MARICILTHEFAPAVGGIATYVHSIAEAAVATGVHNVTVVAPDYGEPISEKNYRVVRNLLHHAASLGGWLATARHLLSHRYDVVHAADLRSVGFSYVFRLFTGQPYIATVHGSEVARIAGRGVLARVLAAAYRCATTLCCNSQATKRSLEAAMIGHADIRVTLLGVSPEWFADPAGTFENVALAALPPDTSLVCTVARIEPRKGQLNAIMALSEGWRSGVWDFVYVVAGPVVDADYQRALELAASEFPGRVLLVGKLSVNDLRRLYRLSDFQVLAAQVLGGRVEGFGLSIIEAAAQGCPTIAADIGGIGEAVEHRKTGLVTSSADPKVLAAAITELSRDAKLLEEMRERAPSYAATWTWERCAAETYSALASSDEPVR